MTSWFNYAAHEAGLTKDILTTNDDIRKALIVGFQGRNFKPFYGAPLFDLSNSDLDAFHYKLKDCLQPLVSAFDMKQFNIKHFFDTISTDVAIVRRGAWLHPFIAELINDSNFYSASVELPKLGLRGYGYKEMDMTDDCPEASFCSNHFMTGFKVIGLDQNGPVFKGGVRVGDVIYTITDDYGMDPTRIRSKNDIVNYLYFDKDMRISRIDQSRFYITQSQKKDGSKRDTTSKFYPVVVDGKINEQFVNYESTIGVRTFEKLEEIVKEDNRKAIEAKLRSTWSYTDHWDVIPMSNQYLKQHKSKHAFRYMPKCNEPLQYGALPAINNVPNDYVPKQSLTLNGRRYYHRPLSSYARGYNLQQDINKAVELVRKANTRLRKARKAFWDGYNAGKLSQENMYEYGYWLSVSQINYGLLSNISSIGGATTWVANQFKSLFEENSKYSGRISDYYEYNQYSDCAPRESIFKGEHEYAKQYDAIARHLETNDDFTGFFNYSDFKVEAPKLYDERPVRLNELGLQTSVTYCVSYRLSLGGDANECLPKKYTADTSVRNVKLIQVVKLGRKTYKLVYEHRSQRLPADFNYSLPVIRKGYHPRGGEDFSRNGKRVYNGTHYYKDKEARVFVGTDTDLNYGDFSGVSHF